MSTHTVNDDIDEPQLSANYPAYNQLATAVSVYGGQIGYFGEKRMLTRAQYNKYNDKFGAGEWSIYENDDIMAVVSMPTHADAEEHFPSVHEWMSIIYESLYYKEIKVIELSNEDNLKKETEEEKDPEPEKTLKEEIEEVEPKEIKVVEGERITFTLKPGEEAVIALPRERSPPASPSKSMKYKADLAQSVLEEDGKPVLVYSEKEVTEPDV